MAGVIRGMEARARLRKRKSVKSVSQSAVKATVTVSAGLPSSRPSVSSIVKKTASSAISGVSHRSHGSTFGIVKSTLKGMFGGR